ncbi:MAG: efflux transporter outer membrane subunit [Acidobacteriota bacterium]|nr:efflux transporter outer membrane subunit [Acidobacteriota bacterium]
MRPIRALPALTLLLAMSGCVSMAPKYLVPAPPVPQAWPGQTTDQAMTGGKPLPAASEIPWQDFYLDARLRKVLELALQNNRDLRIAALNAEKVRAYYRIQRAQLLPAVSALGNVSRQNTSSGSSETTTKYTVGLGVTAWELDFFGRVRSLKDRALEQYLATEQARRSAQIALLGEVANVYLALAADRETLAFVKDTLMSQEESFTLIRRRFEVGVSSELDVNRAQISLETAREDAARLTSLVAQDEHALNLLAGAAVPADLLPEALGSVALLKGISAGLPSEVLMLRPDILAAENQLKAANANIGAARAAYFPRITLTAGVGTESAELSGLFKSGSDTWAFSPQIILPIFDWGTRRANLKVANVDRDIALAQYEKAIQVAFREVADALVQRGALEDQLAAHESLVRALEGTHRLATARYTAGIDGYLGVLDAQRSLYAAKQGLIALRLAKYANMVTLYKVLGGGNPEHGPGAEPLKLAPARAPGP